MKKRKVGERSNPLLDTIDAQILRVVNNYNVGILELGRMLNNISHKNLKNHLEKLHSCKLIFFLKSTDSKSPQKVIIQGREVSPEDNDERSLTEILTDLDMYVNKETIEDLLNLEKTSAKKIKK